MFSSPFRLLIAPLNYPHIDVAVRMEGPGTQDFWLRILNLNTKGLISKAILRANTTAYADTMHNAVTGEEGSITFRGGDRLRILAHDTTFNSPDFSQRTVIAAGEVALPANCS